jgi:hypothetical protein
MNLILQIDEALYFVAMSASNIFRTGMMPSPTATWLSLLWKFVRSFMCMLKQPRADFVDRLHHVGAGANRVPDVDAAADARIHISPPSIHPAANGHNLSSGP